MDWKTLLAILGIASLSSASTYLQDQKCNKDILPTTTTLPDDELMNAFFIADPDPKTGQLRFTVHPQKMLQHKMQGAFTPIFTPYNVWIRTLHDARVRFEQLWVYISRLVASDVAELYGHFRSESTVTAAPRPIINFDKLKTVMDKGCTAYDANKKTWPYSCFDSNFFCSWSKALPLLKPIFLHSTTTDIDGLTCKANTFKSLAMVNKMSQLAVDSDSRAAALKELFAPAIVSRFAEENLQLPLYQSGLVRNGMFLLVSKTGYRDDVIKRQLQAVKDKITTRCTQTAKQPVGKHYYCLAKKFITKTTECNTAGKASPCIYQSIFQNYFSYGAFIYKSENDVVEFMVERMGVSATNLFKVLREKNEVKLRANTGGLRAAISIDVAKCTHDWKRGFKCGQDDFACKIKSFYRWDCQMLYLVRVVEKFLKDKGTKKWNDAYVVRHYKFLSTWLLYPPYLYSKSMTNTEKKAFIDSFQKEVEEARERFQISDFERIITIVPKASFVPSWMPRKMCEAENVDDRHKPFCLLEKLVEAIVILVQATKESRGEKFKYLNPSIDYKVLLEQLQLDRVSQYLSKQSSTYFKMVSDKLEAIPRYLESNFKALSNYFKTLSTFDMKKASSDLYRVQNQINTFRRKYNIIYNELWPKATVIFALSMSASLGESIEKGVAMFLEIVQTANPMTHVLGKTNPNAIVERTNDIVKSGVRTAILGRIQNILIPKLKAAVTSLKNKYAINTKFITTATRLVNEMKLDNDKVKDRIKYFLEYYSSDYSPSVKEEDIQAFGQAFIAAIEEMCAQAFAGTTTASALLEIGLAKTGDCVTLKPMIDRWISLNIEVYNYEFKIVEIIAKAARSILAKRQSDAISAAFVSKVKFDVNFLKSKAIISHLVSSLHVWKIVNEYCNILMYKNNGQKLNYCKEAEENPSHDTVGKIISHKQTMSCGIESVFPIPVKPASATTKPGMGFIDMDKLFKGEPVYFQIPDYEWLKKHIGFTAHYSNLALYLQQFQLYLPIESSRVLVNIRIEPSKERKLRPIDQITYVFPTTPNYRSEYINNIPTCSSPTLKLLYDLCGKQSKICIKRDGSRNSAIPPSLYSRFKITLVDPDNVPAPKPKTEFKLLAAVKYCRSRAYDPQTRSSRGVNESLGESSERRSVGFGAEFELHKRFRRSSNCCTGNKYFNGENCVNCPSGSTPKLSGYYCQ